jgi:Zn-dependent protease with chaperone function/tetratricopeptide (TPR) repeat protein
MFLLVPILFLACFVVTLLATRRQSGGIVRAGAIAAAFLAGLVTIPAAVLAWVASVYELEAHEPALAAALLLLLFAFALRVVKQPFQHAVPVQDPALEAAIARVAQRAGLTRVPRLLRLRTQGALPVYGWVAVLHEPVVILADGLIHRLEPEEHEAILAHEIAHVRTGSLWWLQLPLPVATTIGMILLCWVDIWVAMGATWGLWALLTRLVSRPTELLCDRRAGALTSPAAMIAALRKMHAVHPARDPGWRWSLAWAMATHPPAELRIHALGEDQGPLAQRLRWISALGFALWLLCFGAVLSTWTLLPGLDSFLIGLALGGLGLSLQLSPRLAAHSAIKRRRRLIPPGLPGRRLGQLGWWSFMLGCGLIMTDWAGWWTGLLLLGSVTLLALAAFRARGLRSLRMKISEAMRGQDFALASQLGADHPRQLRRDPALAHDVAMASLACGRRREGLEALEAVVERAPRLRIATLHLGRLALQDDPARSLALADQLTRGMPRDPLGPLLACAAHRRMGQRAEALLRWGQAEALAPDDPDLLIEAVELAMDAGALQEAEAWAAKARARAPGELGLQLAEARLALERGEHAAARVRLDRARAIMADHPLAFLTWRIEALEGALEGEEPDGARR